MSRAVSSRTTPSVGATVSIEVQAPRPTDLLVQNCSQCGNQLILDSGDVLFGGEWYHAACWQLMKLTKEGPAQRRPNPARNL